MEKKKAKSEEKLKEEWVLDNGIFNTKQLNIIRLHLEGRAVDQLLLREVSDIIIENKKEYYSKKETERIVKIKKGVLTDDIIKKQEITYKKHLFEKIIRYGYKIEYVKEYLNLINLEYLVNVKNFFNLRDGSYMDKTLSVILEYEEIINDFISNLDKKDIDKYNNTKYASPKHIYPLTMNEYVESKKS